MGVCCIVFDGMLLKKAIFKNSNYFLFHVFFAFYVISNIFRKQKFSGRKGGGGVKTFFGDVSFWTCWWEISGDRVAELYNYTATNVITIRMKYCNYLPTQSCDYITMDEILY